MLVGLAEGEAALSGWSSGAVHGKPQNVVQWYDESLGWLNRWTAAK